MGTLKAMPIKVLDNFFHYVLHVRRASVRHASTLQTYWNVFTLMRRKETGIVDINPLVKTQMHGVSCPFLLSLHSVHALMIPRCARD